MWCDFERYFVYRFGLMRLGVLSTWFSFCVDSGCFCAAEEDIRDTVFGSVVMGSAAAAVFSKKDSEDCLCHLSVPSFV